MTHAMAQKPALDADDLYYTDMPVGEILRRAREHYRQSLPDIERALRIKMPQIQAIEQGDVENLPGRVYAIGFVRSYAEYLGLDGDKMVMLFKSQYGRKTSDPELDFPVGAAESKLPPLWLLGACVAAVILMSALWWTFKGSERTEITHIPDVAAALSYDNATLSEESYGPYIPKGYDSSVEVKVVEEAVPEGVTLTMTQKSWVEIRDQQGKTLASQFLKKGDQYFVPNRPDLSMSLGNAAGVSLDIDGKTVGSMGKSGEVLRDVPLDLDYLQKTYAPEE